MLPIAAIIFIIYVLQYLTYTVYISIRTYIRADLQTYHDQSYTHTYYSLRIILLFNNLYNIISLIILLVA